MNDYQYAPEVAFLVEEARKGTIAPPPGEGRHFMDYTHFEFGPAPQHARRRL